MSLVRILVIDSKKGSNGTEKYLLEKNNCEMDVFSKASDVQKKDIGNYNLLLIGEMAGIVSEFNLTKELYKESNAAGIPVIFFTDINLNRTNTSKSEVGAEQYMEIWRRIGNDL